MFLGQPSCFVFFLVACVGYVCVHVGEAGESGGSGERKGRGGKGEFESRRCVELMSPVGCII